MYCERYLKSAGEEGQNGRALEIGWQLSFRKSLQENTLSFIWLKLVPYLTGFRMSDDIYFDLSSNGSSKNLLTTPTISLITSIGMPWFTIYKLHTVRSSFFLKILKIVLFK